MNQFADGSVKFGIIPPERSEEVCQFFNDEFLTHEPISRSIGAKPTKLIDMKVRSAVKGGSCIMATNDQDKIIGIRLTEVVCKNDRSKWFVECLIKGAVLPWTWLFRMHDLHKIMRIAIALFDQLDYDPWKMFDRYNCLKMLVGICVCSSSTAGGKGLGTEMVRRGEIVGKEMGCEYSALVVTGNYSAKIFRDKLNYVVENQLFYADFKDENGEMYFGDTGEHKSCLVCVKEL